MVGSRRRLPTKRGRRRVAEGGVGAAPYWRVQVTQECIERAAPGRSQPARLPALCSAAAAYIAPPQRKSALPSDHAPGNRQKGRRMRGGGPLERRRARPGRSVVQHWQGFVCELFRSGNVCPSGPPAGSTRKHATKIRTFTRGLSPRSGVTT